MKYNMKWFLFVPILCLILVNCTDYDEYKKYILDGERIYLQKADSLKTYPGKNRIQLEWILVDPKVTSCKVYYEQAGIQDVVIVEIPAYENRDNDTIRITINNLEETIYSFKIISYDDYGNSSIPVETEAQAYGDEYEKSLLNCHVINTEYDFEIKSLSIEWGTVEASVIDVELSYTDIDDVSKTIIIDPSEGQTTLVDFKLGEPLLYCTRHKPISIAIDMFLADWERIYIELIDNVVLNKPITSSGSANSSYTEVNAVDGNKTGSTSRWISAGPYTSPNLSPPQWLEIDLQGFFEISGFGMWRDNAYIVGSQKFSLQAWIEDDWIDVFTEEYNIMTTYSIEFNSMTTDKVRFYIHPTVFADYLIRLFEIEVYSVVKY